MYREKTYRIWKSSHIQVNIKSDFRIIYRVQIGLNRPRISGEFSFSNVCYVAQLSSSCFLYKCCSNDYKPSCSHRYISKRECLFFHFPWYDNCTAGLQHSTQ